MRVVKLMVPAMACALFTVMVNAQVIEHPTSVKPIGFTYDYYKLGQPSTPEASPSDVVPEPDAVASGGKGKAAPSCGCATSCDNCGGCDSCGCNGGCGCGCSCYLFGPDEAWSLQSHLFGDCGCGPTIGGWLQAGWHDGLVPMSFARDDLRSFGDVPNVLQINQAYLYIERAAEGGDCCWDWGYRVDGVYGTEAQKMQAFGNPLQAGAIAAGTGSQRGWDNPWDNGVYGWAIPQAYIELARGDWSIKAGHFYTLVGYEVITSPDNFFYTHAYTMFNSEPFTHTGVIATHDTTENLDTYWGWTLGWDTGFDQFDNGSSWLGGFSYSINDDLSLTYISTAGNLGFRGTQAYTHSIVMQAQMTNKLSYVLQSDFVHIGAGSPGAGAVPFGTGNDQIGINQYMFYSLSDCLSIGGRMEWWKTDSISYYEVTGGINYKPHANITLRPELRYDWTPSRVNDLNGQRAYQPFGGNANVFDATTFSMDMIFTF